MSTTQTIQTRNSLEVCEATLLVKPIPPTVQYFLEYEYINNPNLAYVLPCDKLGHVNVDALSDDALDHYYHIAERDDEFTDKGIHKAESGGLPLIFVCTCGTMLKFTRFQEPELTCLGCYTQWSWSDALNLPLAEKETIQE